MGMNGDIWHDICLQGAGYELVDWSEQYDVEDEDEEMYFEEEEEEA